MSRLFVLAALLGACGSASAPAPTVPTFALTRSATIAIDGGPNGITWSDADGGVLYVTDDDGPRILRWHDGRGVDAIPLGDAGLGAKVSLGGVVQRADGTLLVDELR